MKRVVIVGGGFAGLSAARRIGKRRGVEVLLIDRRDASEFLPLLPDLIGGRTGPESLRFPLADEARRLGVRFRRGDVSGIDIPGRQVDLAGEKIGYDAAVLATGTETHYHGRNDLASFAHSTDSVADAEAIRKEADGGRRETFVIAGGGYTGVEVATNLWRRLKSSGRSGRIVIVEPADRLCAGVPSPTDGGLLMSAQTFPAYVERQMGRLGIETRLGTTVKGADGERVVLSDGEEFSRAMLVWCAGVHTGRIVRETKRYQTRQGRLCVDQCLRLDETTFVAGDAAAFVPDAAKRELRMGIQFSLCQGRRAAANVLRVLDGRPPKQFRPVDLGFVIPMAHGRACGRILGLPVTGRVPSWMHYFMCVFRTWGLANRYRLLRDLLRP